MNSWPYEISLDAFKQTWQLEGEPLWRSVFEMHKDKMQIKNPAVAVVNLEKIFNATFKLANSKGFQAMSLRDLSKETGISMGGLYAYIGSKNDLAMVIEGVLRNYVDRAIGGLSGLDLDPVKCLKAIVFGELYMMEIMNPWYYFCFMELKGLPKEQQQQTLDLELRFDGILMDAFRAGENQGLFTCRNPELLASQVTAQLQQWHLKHWKFKLHNVTTEQYGAFIFDELLLSLGYAAAGDRQAQADLRPLTHSG